MSGPGCGTAGAGTYSPGFHQVADSINVVVGTPVGTVADIQNFQDGNSIDIQEAAATPGINVEINFTNIISARRFGMSVYYEGTHWIEAQLWDYVNLAWITVWTFGLGLGFNYRYSDLPPLSNGAKVIDASGNVMGRLYHPSGGNASHDLFIDYAAIIS